MSHHHNRNHHHNAGFNAEQVELLKRQNKWDLLLYNKLREAEALCSGF